MVYEMNSTTLLCRWKHLQQRWDIQKCATDFSDTLEAQDSGHTLRADGSTMLCHTQKHCSVVMQIFVDRRLMVFGSNHGGAFFPFFGIMGYFSRGTRSGAEMSAPVFPQTTMWGWERRSIAPLYLHGSQWPSRRFWLAYSCLRQAWRWRGSWYSDPEKQFFPVYVLCSRLRINHGGKTCMRFVFAFLPQVCDRLPVREVMARKVFR